MDTLTPAVDRFFRCYAKHCLEPDPDTLFAYLNALHSFNDKLGKSKKGNLFGSVEFIALKALRNLFHHEAELATACLVKRRLVELALERDQKQPERFADAFRWYGDIADIQPGVFNGTVYVYEAVRSAGLEPESEAFGMFDRSYRFETENGHAHRVTGVITCLAGDVDEVLRKAFGAAAHSTREEGRLHDDE